MFQMKDHTETTALLGHQEKEGHEVKKAVKDSLV